MQGWAPWLVRRIVPWPRRRLPFCAWGRTGGKRFRPALLYAGFRAFEADSAPEAAWQAGVAMVSGEVAAAESGWKTAPSWARKRTGL